MLRLPQGYRAAGVYSGVKRNTSQARFVARRVRSAGRRRGVYTQNLVCAAPVKIDRERTPSDSIRCVAINSGVANACTGDQGDGDAEQMAAWAAKHAASRPSKRS